MSDYCDQLVALGIAEHDAHAVAVRLDSWLCDAGWVVDRGVEPEWRSGSTSSRYLRRPGAAHADELDWEAIANLCVDQKGELWHPGETYAGPRCPVCGWCGEASSQAEMAWVDSDDEPTVRCEGCGFGGLLGDWDNEGSVVRSPLAVVLWLQRLDLDPEPFVPALLAALRSDFGGRWTHVFQKM